MGFTCSYNYHMVGVCLPCGRCARMRDSKERILDIAAKRFARHGYEGTSLQGIADEVGMRKPSLLYHFPSKKALREAVITDLLGRWQTRLPEVLARAGEGQDRFTALFEEVSMFFEHDPSRALLVMREVVDRPVETRERLGAAVRPWRMASCTAA